MLSLSNAPSNMSLSLPLYLFEPANEHADLIGWNRGDRRMVIVVLNDRDGSVRCHLEFAGFNLSSHGDHSPFSTQELRMKMRSG